MNKNSRSFVLHPFISNSTQWKAHKAWPYLGLFVHIGGKLTYFDMNKILNEYYIQVDKITYKYEGHWYV